ncbi:MAG: sensor signal transduction histidine kinase [Asticcacaulis sp.]|uniref:sensor signal transduction histidine kinase n=1 Tax=Asticcacaulis sp. TaxID=1872648 RepID=UPI0025B8A1F4|nr:sensor signal transduction histidine kinase [Asticcacaulis sp.]MCA1935126.1 sensor signal transduction histidine kinase [Asticcacaulis sp.]
MRWFFRMPILVSFIVSTIITASYLYEIAFGHGRAGWPNVLAGLGLMIACVGFHFVYKFIEWLGKKIDGETNKPE